MEHLSKIEKFDRLFIRVASEVSDLSYCKRNKVGAILVVENRILSIGYNGTPSGMENECEDDCGNTKKIVMHAESNCLMHLCKSSQSSKDSTMYITLSPCIECAKLIYQAGVKKVVYLDKYRNIEGIEFLKNVGIEIKQSLWGK
jgi:dCMP deaminase